MTDKPRRKKRNPCVRLAAFLRSLRSTERTHQEPTL